VFPEKVQNDFGQKKVIESIQQNEKLFSQKTHATQIGVWEWEVATGKVIWVHGADTLLATKPENVNTYEAFLNRIHPEDQNLVMEAIACSVTTTSEYDVKFRIVWDDSTVRWVQGKGSYLQDNTDKAPRMISTIMDITESEQTEKALLLTQQRLQHLLKSSPAIIYSCKAAGDRKITFFSENITAILGYEISECLDNPRFWFDRIHPDDAQRVFSGAPKLFQNGYDIQEYRFRHKDDSYRWMRDQAKLVKDDFGNLMEIVGSWVDISERKAAEIALQIANQELENRVAQRTTELTNTLQQLQDKIAEHQQTEKELRQKTSELEAIFLALPDLYFWLNADGTILHYKAVNTQNLYVSPDVFLGKQMQSILPPNVGEPLQAAIEKVLETKSLVNFDYSLPLPQGEVYFEARLIPLPERQIIAIIRDISDRKRHEEALAERVRLVAFRADVDAALTQSDTLQGIMHGCTEALVKHIDAAFARIWTLNKANNVLELQVSSGMYTQIDGLHRSVPVGKFKIGLIAEEGKPYLTNSVLTDPRVIDKDWAQRENMIAFAGYPLIVEGKTFGVIAMFARKALSESTLAALEFAADEIAIGIQRKQAEEALRESEARLGNLIETTNDWVWEVDTNGVYTYISPKIRDVLGYEPEEILGKSPFDLMLPEEASRVEEIFTSLIASQKPLINIENTNRHKQGHLVVLETNGVPFFDTSGNILGYRGIDRDISERKQAEEALQALVAGTASVTGEEFFPAVVRHLAAALGVRYALVAEQTSKNPGKARILAFWRGDSLAETFEYELANTPCEISLNQRIAYYPSCLQQQFPEDTDLVAMQAESYLGCSLIDTNGKVIGHLAVLDTKPILEEKRAKAILSIFAARATAELQRQRTQNALQQSETKFRILAQREALLNRLSSQIRASLDVNTILQTAVTEIRDLLHIDRCTFIWYYYDAQKPYWKIVQEAKNSALPSTVGFKVAHAEVKSISEKVLNKEIFRVDDVQALPESGLREMLLWLGYTAVLTLPIHSQSGEIGLLCCTNSTGGRNWRAREVELLLAVADQLAIAIDQAKLYKQSHTTAQIAQEKAQQLEKALGELSSAQAQLIQTEKMSSLGQLVAGVAHEINNPVSFIYGNLTHASEYTQDLLRLIELYHRYYTNPVPEIENEIQAIDLDFLKQDLPKLLHSMMMGADRISQIVVSLRNFSRLDEADMKPVDIHQGIDSALLLLQNRLKKLPEQPQIEIIKEYGNLPQVECYAGQLNQVFMSLLTNAIDVLESLVNSPDKRRHPQIRIRTEIPNDEQVLISIADNGPGMTEEIRKRIFDPFFTTKAVGKGSGMGLSISYQIIVEKHRGEFKCISAPGQGAEFIITIPLQQRSL